ncbi:hypothetical protein [Candidatus Poriferisodalis sp.]|uniref:hypothetical protein n=1 Tax=Candidatus Poriferisodalis sp. TaxID=3101277 RepID=UPI003B010C08
MDIDTWDEQPLLHAQQPSTDEEWRASLGQYLEARNDLPLLRCLAVARESGASTLVAETGYIDADYRSEYGSYFAHQFRHRPDTAHRLHFFSERLSLDEIERGTSPDSYLGYVVLRPCETGPVSRAMLQPPPSVAGAVRTSVVDKINLCGQDLAVSGVPFSQQDAQMGSCAHASAWMCHYTAALRGDAARQTTGYLAECVDSKLNTSRPIPTQGLTVLQLSELFRYLGLPAYAYEVGSLPSPGLPWQRSDPTPPSGGNPVPPGTWDDRIVPVVCRFLNSGLPVLVGAIGPDRANGHAFVLCGYKRTTRDGKRWVEFVRHDDQRGPYLRVDDVLADIDPDTGHSYGPWSTIHIPAPEKLWLGPEHAERAGGLLLHRQATLLGNDQQSVVASQLHDIVANGRFSVRSYAMRSNRFKSELPTRGVPSDVAVAYRLMSLPRYVWVVEAIDRARRDRGEPCVLGETLWDATSSDHRPEVLTSHMAGFMLIASNVRSCSESPIFVSADFQPYESGGVGPV